MILLADYIGSFRPLNFQSRDMGLFKDDDGTAYLLTEDVSCCHETGVLQVVEGKE
jgi:hypothetical protein